MSVIEYAGVASLLYLFVYKPLKLLVSWLANNKYCHGVSERILNPGPEDYAVITGATDGIGLEYARQLADKGYNLVLLSRTEEKLQKVASEISKQYPKCKNIETITVDFSKADIYRLIEKRLSAINGRMHVLVNNVGYANDLPNRFSDLPEDHIQAAININVLACTEMSHIILKLMLSKINDPQSKSTVNGVIINISSGAGLDAFPLISTYSASKNYMNALSKILSAEYAADNIIVQMMTPGQVDTKFGQGVRTPAIVPADECVRYALKAVGTEQQTNGHPKHKFIHNALMTVGGIIGDRLFTKLKMSLALDHKKQLDKILLEKSKKV